MELDSLPPHLVAHHIINILLMILHYIHYTPEPLLNNVGTQSK